MLSIISCSPIYQPSAGVNILFIFHSQLVKNVRFGMEADLSYNPETSDFEFGVIIF